MKANYEQPEIAVILFAEDVILKSTVDLHDGDWGVNDDVFDERI